MNEYINGDEVVKCLQAAKYFGECAKNESKGNKDLAFYFKKKAEFYKSKGIDLAKTTYAIEQAEEEERENALEELELKKQREYKEAWLKYLDSFWTSCKSILDDVKANLEITEEEWIEYNCRWGKQQSSDFKNLQHQINNRYKTKYLPYCEKKGKKPMTINDYLHKYNAYCQPPIKSLNFDHYVKLRILEIAWLKDYRIQDRAYECWKNGKVYDYHDYTRDYSYVKFMDENGNYLPKSINEFETKFYQPYKLIHF